MQKYPLRTVLLFLSSMLFSMVSVRPFCAIPKKLPKTNLFYQSRRAISGGEVVFCYNPLLAVGVLSFGVFYLALKNKEQSPTFSPSPFFKSTWRVPSYAFPSTLLFEPEPDFSMVPQHLPSALVGLSAANQVLLLQSMAELKAFDWLFRRGIFTQKRRLKLPRGFTLPNICALLEYLEKVKKAEIAKGIAKYTYLEITGDEGTIGAINRIEQRMEIYQMLAHYSKIRSDDPKKAFETTQYIAEKIDQSVHFQFFEKEKTKALYRRLLVEGIPNQMEASHLGGCHLSIEIKNDIANDAQKLLFYTKMLEACKKIGTMH